MGNITLARDPADPKYPSSFPCGPKLPVDKYTVRYRLSVRFIIIYLFNKNEKTNPYRHIYQYNVLPDFMIFENSPNSAVWPIGYPKEYTITITT